MIDNNKLNRIIKNFERETFLKSYYQGRIDAITLLRDSLIKTKETEGGYPTIDEVVDMLLPKCIESDKQNYEEEMKEFIESKKRKE